MIFYRFFAYLSSLMFVISNPFPTSVNIHLHVVPAVPGGEAAARGPPAAPADAEAEAEAGAGAARGRRLARAADLLNRRGAAAARRGSSPISGRGRRQAGAGGGCNKK